MELMILLLQYPITRCSISVHYFPSTPSEYRLRSVKPMHLLNKSDNDVSHDDGGGGSSDDDDDEQGEQTPYWDDAIDKYFDRPEIEPFRNLSYPEYFQNYTIRSKVPGPRSKLLYAETKKIESSLNEGHLFFCISPFTKWKMASHSFSNT
jgi:hypothetical protein